jgi:hypothetical protein
MQITLNREAADAFLRILVAIPVELIADCGLLFYCDGSTAAV